MKSLLIRAEEQLLKEFKLLCVNQDVSMSEVIQNLIKHYINNNKVVK